MRKTLLFLAAALFGGSMMAQDPAAPPAGCGPFAFESYSKADSAGMVGLSLTPFELSQDYPATLPSKPALPWEKSDFRAGSGGFMKQVLDYCWEGMDSARWVAQNNPVRKWYHAPNLESGYDGREFARGLRMERTSNARELHAKQTEKVRNYSITYYNDLAAYTIGQVWCDPDNPDASKAKFPVGSVWFKLIFTTTDTSDAPYLLNAMEWDAYTETGTENPITRKMNTVRLIQVDFGVRVAAKEAVNGWVFGVYVYSGQKSGSTYKDKLVPIGLQWGNDPTLKADEARNGSKPVTETWVNTGVWNPNAPDQSLVQNIGWGYRLAGPIGNHNTTSIMAEHMTAGWPPAPRFAPFGTQADSILNKWFRNLPSGTPFEAGQTSLDYNLELVDGLRNHAIAKGDTVLRDDYTAYLTEVLGFKPVIKGQPGSEEAPVYDIDENLEGRNLYVFIGFMLLIAVLIGLLVWNFLRK